MLEALEANVEPAALVDQRRRSLRTQRRHRQGLRPSKRALVVGLEREPARFDVQHHRQAVLAAGGPQPRQQRARLVEAPDDQAALVVAATTSGNSSSKRPAGPKRRETGAAEGRSTSASGKAVGLVPRRRGACGGKAGKAQPRRSPPRRREI